MILILATAKSPLKIYFQKAYYKPTNNILVYNFSLLMMTDDETIFLY